MGILGSLFGKRKPVVAYRTIDGGHPAPFPDMTDEQLYNYEIAFNVPRRTFDKPPPATRRAKNATNGTTAGTTIKREAPMNNRDPGHEAKATPQRASQKTQQTRDRDQSIKQEQAFAESRDRTPAPPPQEHEAKPLHLPPLDLNKPVRLITSKQPVEIITTRARHPVYKVHAYIGNDDVVTLFTLDGRLSENGPRYLENVPQRQQLYLNIYPNQDTQNGQNGDRFTLTQHVSRQEADDAAKPERIACAAVQFDL